MSENIANLEILTEISQKIYIDEIVIDGKKVFIKTRAPTIRDLAELDKMAGKNSFNYLIFLVQKCLVEPRASQMDIEGWNSGVVNAIGKKINSHSDFDEEKKISPKDSPEVTKEKSS